MVVSQRKSHMNVNNCWQTVQNWCKRNSIWNGNNKKKLSTLCFCIRNNMCTLHPDFEYKFTHFERSVLPLGLTTFLLSRRLRAKARRTMHFEWSMARTNESYKALKFPKNILVASFHAVLNKNFSLLVPPQSFVIVVVAVIIGCTI